uniref:GM03661p n=1 Tax=Drosophila melanogaster TaxID=7227 RepID=Q95SB9_DROME|nr:GM03661p [Drosophila melanogaster]
MRVAFYKSQSTVDTKCTKLFEYNLLTRLPPFPNIAFSYNTVSVFQQFSSHPYADFVQFFFSANFEKNCPVEQKKKLEK